MEEIGLLDCRRASTSMDSSVDVWNKQNLLFADVTRYKILIEKFIYLTVIKPHIAYVVGSVSQSMHQPREASLIAALALRIMIYVKRAQDRGL